GLCSPCTGRSLASRRVATTLVGSYPTFSPLPSASLELCRRRSPFCSTFRRLSPPGLAPASCPAVSGLSSSASRRPRSPGLRRHCSLAFLRRGGVHMVKRIVALVCFVAAGAVAASVALADHGDHRHCQKRPGKVAPVNQR